MRCLLRDGAGIEEKIRRTGETALMLAVAKDHKSCIDVLLENKADVGARDKKDWTPLHHAAFHGSSCGCGALLQSGASMEAVDTNMQRPLLLAASHDHTGVVELLLSRGANVEASDAEGNTALMWASEKGNLSMVQVLLRHGASGAVANRFRLTALGYAVKNEHLEVVEELVKGSAYKNPVDIDDVLRVAEEPSIKRVLIDELERRKNVRHRDSQALFHGHKTRQCAARGSSLMMNHHE